MYMVPQNVPGESDFLGAGRRVDPVDGRDTGGHGNFGIFENPQNVFNCTAIGWPGLSAQGRFQKQVCCGCQSILF